MARGKKYSNTTVPRYQYKQYLYRSIGGIVPREMAMDITNAQTEEWVNQFAKVRRIREGVRPMLISAGIPSSEWGMYYALALKLYKSAKKMKASGMTQNDLTNTIAGMASQFAESKGLDAEIAVRIADYVSRNV